MEGKSEEMQVVLSALELGRHAHALAVSGYTTVPGQIDERELAALRTAAQLALEAESKSVKKQPYTLVNDYYKAVRCMYSWGDACVRLLEHPTIHGIASLLMREYVLWDMTLLSALPAPESTAAEGSAAATTAWHRDFDGPYRGAQMPGHLWFFVCLDDVTSRNGATWVVPGSHRLDSQFEPAADEAWARSLEQFPSRLQLCAEAGDLLILDPTMLHTSGRNNSALPRRLLNVGLCHGHFQPLMDHRSIAQPLLRSGASDRVRGMLGEKRASLDTSWPVLPEGWQTRI